MYLGGSLTDKMNEVNNLHTNKQCFIDCGNFCLSYDSKRNKLKKLLNVISNSKKLLADIVTLLESDGYHCILVIHGRHMKNSDNNKFFTRLEQKYNCTIISIPSKKGKRIYDDLVWLYASLLSTSTITNIITNDIIGDILHNLELEDRHYLSNWFNSRVIRHNMSELKSLDDKVELIKNQVNISTKIDDAYVVSFSDSTSYLFEK